MFEDDNRTSRRGIQILPRYNKTIVAHCDGVHGFCTPSGANGTQGEFPSSVQNTMDPVTTCNNCILNISRTGEHGSPSIDYVQRWDNARQTWRNKNTPMMMTPNAIVAHHPNQCHTFDAHPPRSSAPKKIWWQQMRGLSIILSRVDDGLKRRRL